MLDIGCGAGQTTRDAARLASDGWALGVDISKEMIERAHLLAEAEGSTTSCSNTPTRRTPGSRLSDSIWPSAGSARCSSATRSPHSPTSEGGYAVPGRLLMMVWQAHERNEWSVSIERALAATVGSPVPTSEGLDPFSLADPATVRRVLDAAGFTDVTFTDVRQPIYYGQDVAAALEWVGGFACTKEVLDRLDPTGRELALERLARDARRSRSGGRRLVRLARLDREGAPPVTPADGENPSPRARRRSTIRRRSSTAT